MRMLVLLAFAMMVTANVIGMPSEELKLDLKDDIPLEHKTINQTFVTDIVKIPKGLKSQSRFQSRQRSRVPRRLCVKVKAFYNRPFKNFLRRNGWRDTEKAIKSIFRTANQIYRYPGLDTKISLRLIGKPTYVGDRVADRWEVTETSNWLDDASIRKRLDRSADHFAFFCKAHNQHDKNVGRAYGGSVCSAPQARSSLNEFTKDIKNTALTLAHEIGHALGMEHDFVDEWGQNYPRYAGRENCNILGVMGYSSDPNKWSKCSNIYLKNHWNKYGGRNCMRCGRRG